jgi:threonine aldolase
VSECFSKGLGAPVGSVLAGSRELIDEARRYRKMLGGGMRQVGVLCAAALHALEHHRVRLADDHANARRLAEGLAALPRVTLDLSSVQTNLVIFDVSGMTASELARRAASYGVRVNAIAPQRLRAVTHLDVSTREIDDALGHFARALREA